MLLHDYSLSNCVKIKQKHIFIYIKCHYIENKVHKAGFIQLPNILDKVSNILIRLSICLFDALSELIEVEFEYLEQLAISSSVKTATFPAIKTIEYFDFEF